MLNNRGWSSRYVGKANLFYSHVQSEHPAEIGIALLLGGLWSNKAKFFCTMDYVPVWVDAFSLRQLRSDFQPADIVNLIGRIHRRGSICATFSEQSLAVGRRARSLRAR